MKRFAIIFALFLCLPAMACKSGYYLVVNKNKTSLWFESREACKRAAVHDLNLLTHQYRCISTK